MSDGLIIMTSTGKSVSFILVLMVAGIAALLVYYGSVSAGFASQDDLAFALIAFAVLTVAIYEFKGKTGS